MRSVIFFIRLILCIIFFYFGISKVSAQNSYAYADIPEAMKKNANAVVIKDKRIITIESDGKFKIDVIKAVCVLNENGKHMATQPLHYDRFTRVNDFSAKLYDASGSQIKRKELTKERDFGAVMGGQLFVDTRYKVISAEWNQYPYTIEFQYSYTTSEGIHYPNWQPVPAFNIAVIKASLIVRTPAGFYLRYLEANHNINCQKSISPETSVYSWELNNQPAFIEESYSPKLEELSPVVFLSPTIIDFGGYKGNFDSWKSFGKWIVQVNRETEELPESTKTKIRDLVSTYSTKREKVKAVYEYMQNSTRYVGLQVGIGGFKPIDAKDVDRLGYGDCKALSNYTKSLLNAAEIRSFYTLIGAGDNKKYLNANFPSSPFTHVILCVPDEKDTIWLECTSQISPFNYLGDFTSGRPALLITDDGGVLVNTPEFHSGKCERTRKINLELDETGSGVARVKTTYSGIHYDDYVPMLVKDKESRKKAIAEGIRIPKFELLDFSISEFKIENPYADEYLEIFVNTLFTNAGIKKIMQTNLMSRLDRNPFTGRERMTDIYISWPYKAIDTINYKLPIGFTPDKLPKPYSLTGDFASYSNETTYKNGILQYVRVLEIFPGTYPKERYAEFSAFFDKVVSSDAMKIALIKPE